jgi:hypothetical protein
MLGARTGERAARQSKCATLMIERIISSQIYIGSGRARGQLRKPASTGCHAGRRGGPRPAQLALGRPAGRWSGPGPVRAPRSSSTSIGARRHLLWLCSAAGGSASGQFARAWCCRPGARGGRPLAVMSNRRPRRLAGSAEITLAADLRRGPTSWGAADRRRRGH